MPRPCIRCSVASSRKSRARRRYNGKDHLARRVSRVEVHHGPGPCALTSPQAAAILSIGHGLLAPIADVVVAKIAPALRASRRSLSIAAPRPWTVIRQGHAVRTEFLRTTPAISRVD